MSQQKPNHLAWSVMFSSKGDLKNLSEASLFVAMKKIHTPPFPESFQAVLGVLQNGELVLNVPLYDRGPTSSFGGSSRSKNFLMINHNEDKMSCALFVSEKEAKFCHNVIELATEGNQTASDRLFVDSPSLEENNSLCGLPATSEQILRILNDPTFPSFLREIESLLTAKCPSQTAALLLELEKEK